MEFMTYVYLVFGLVLVQVAGSVAFAVLLHRTIVKVDQNYSLSVRLKYKLPFASDWPSAVRQSDVPVIGGYRRVLVWFYVFSIAMIALHYPLWLWFSAGR
jgi:hypothetical protein